MKSCSYNSDELAYLHNLLETLISEAKQMSLELSAEDIIERLYDLADEGERDLNRFRAAILKSAASTSARRAAWLPQATACSGDSACEHCDLD